MPKAGRYEYPVKDLDYCIKVLQKAQSVAKEHVFTRDGFAQAVELSAKGGNFANIVGSLSMFKLVETGDREIRYTELAKTILHGEQDEKSKAESQAVRNVALFADLYDKYGANPTNEQVRHFLRERGNVDISEVNNLSKTVSKLFKKLANHIISDAKDQDDDGKGGEDKVNENESMPERWMLISPYGKHEIKDAASLMAANTLLSTLYSKYPDASPQRKQNTQQKEAGKEK